jgi:MFS family permease
MKQPEPSSRPEPESPYRSPEQQAVTSPLPVQSRFVMLGFFCVAAVIAYVQRTAIGMVTADIQKSLNVSVETLGWIMSAYYWSYAFSQLPAGMLVRLFGTRAILPLSVGATSLFTAMTALMPTTAGFTVMWLMAGISIAGIFPACVRSIGLSFPSDQRAFPSGALASSMSIGGAMSTTMTGLLMAGFSSMETTPWRLVFLLYSVPGILWAASFYFWYRDPAVQTAAASIGGPSEDVSSVGTMVQKHSPLDKPDWYLDHRTWLICGQQFFRAAGYVFYATWFPGYLKEVHHVSLASAGMLTSLPLLGVVLGGITGGMICDRIEQSTGSRRMARQGAGMICHTLCGLLIFLAHFVETPGTAVALISLGSLIFALGSSGSYAVNMDLGGSRSSTLFATMNMSGNIGAAISPIIVGRIVSQLGWSAVLPFFGGVYLAAAGCWMFLNPTGISPNRGAASAAPPLPPGNAG